MQYQSNICNTLRISPDYLLQDKLEENEISKIKESEVLRKGVLPSKQKLIKAALSIMRSKTASRFRLAELFSLIS